MYKNCTTEYTALRQAELEECLLKNMLLKPYCEISIIELCQQSSISRKSFYRYFGSKDGCLTSLLDRMLMESSRRKDAGTSGASDIYTEFFHVLSFWKEHADLLRVLISNDLAYRLLDRTIQHILREEHSFLKQLGVIDPEHAAEPLLFATSGFMVLLLNWAQSGFRKPAEEMAAAIADLFTNPLIPDTGKG